MARLGGRLTAKQVATLRPPKGKKRHDFADGRCLYLQTTVARDGHINRSWLLKYEIAFVGRREMGLGPTYDVSLAEARVRARFHRQQLRDGIDPLTAKRAARQALLAQKASVVTFREVADMFISANEGGWKNDKHRR
jgi:hypothetical protein